MPLTKVQSVLKKWLPKQLFTFLYRVACYFYGVWQKTADSMYYFGSRVYYTLKHDKDKLRKLNTIKQILPYTMVGRTGLLSTYDTALKVENSGAEGCFVECGVARGGCSALMALVARDNKNSRESWLFDSFEGLPEQTSEDEYQEPIIAKPEDRSASVVAPGYCLGTFEEVEELLFNKLNLNRDNIHLVKGWFEDTLPEYRNKTGNISILRIDGDWYESTKCCLESLYDNVISGGYIIIDDYQSVVGCKKAVDEFIKNRGLDIELGFDKRGGCYFIKPN